MTAAIEKTPVVTQFEEAVAWAVKASMKAAQCKICNFRAFPHKPEASLRAHIQKKHQLTIVDLFEADSFDLSKLADDSPEDGEDPLLHAAGIVEQVVPERYNYLRVPEGIKREIEVQGARGRWVRKDRVEYFKALGATTTRLQDGEEGAKQPSTEDGILRTQELTHMTMPHKMVRARVKQRAERMQDQLNARAEEQTIIQDEHEKRTYDYLRTQENYDHQKASQVARALSSRRKREGSHG
jgi:hypothetical protein